MPGEKTTILIVEDESVIADYLCSQLQELGYTVGGIAPDYESAIDLINKYFFDLILLDIELEGEKTGIDIACYLNEKSSHPPFIYLTSYSDPVTLRQAKTTRPAAYLTKPFTSAGLFSAIEIVLYNQISRTPEEVITINDGSIPLQFNESEILYLEAEHVYVTVVTKERRFLIRSSLSSLLAALPANVFLRVHRSYTVNVSHIRVIRSGHIIVGDHTIPIGRKFRESIASLRR